MSECVSVCICVVSALRLCSFLFHFKSVDSFLILAFTSHWIYPTIITVISTRRAKGMLSRYSASGFYSSFTDSVQSRSERLLSTSQMFTFCALCTQMHTHTHTHLLPLDYLFVTVSQQVTNNDILLVSHVHFFRLGK